MTLLLSNLVYADDIVSDTTIESMEIVSDAEDADSVTGEAIEDNVIEDAELPAEDLDLADEEIIEDQTEVVTEEQTEADTEVATEELTEAITEVVTEELTEAVTEISDEQFEIAEPETEEPTEITTEVTELMTEVVSESEVRVLNSVARATTGKLTEGVVGGSLEYESDGEAITITKAVGTIVSAVIPESIDGVPVTAIGDSAFNQKACANTLMEITLPDTIVSIGKNAFSDRVQLITINMPASLQTIGNNAFDGCSRLKTLDMRGITLTEMGTGVFKDCISLTGVNTGEDTSCFYFPSGLTILPKDTFSGCTRLQNISGLEGIEKIDESAFEGCEFFDQIYIPSSVTEIGKSAFNGCTRMVTVTGCEQLGTLGDGVFNGCTSLINLPVDIMEQRISAWGTSVFNGCTSLRNFKIPTHVYEIPDNTFSGCIMLQDMEIPDNIQRVGVSAFENCTSLTKVDLTTQLNLNIIEKEAWRGCTGVTEVTIVAPNLRGIDANAFSECTSLKTATITSECPDGLSLGGGVFGACTALKDCTFNATFSLDDKDFFGESTFEDCISLVNVNFAEGLATLPERTFYNCTSLKWDSEKFLPSTIRTIGPEAFGKCTFDKVDIPDRIQVIDEAAFSGCTKMTDFTTTTSLRLIGNEAFSGCTSLVNIPLYDGLETINDGAFANCTSLVNISVPDTVVYMGNSVFSGCSALKNVKLTNKLEAATTNMFKKCTSLESIDLSNTRVTSIKANAFDGCTSLKYVKWPKDISSIDNYAFRGCTALTEITFPRSLLTLSKNVFDGCTSLTECNLNEGLEVIGVQAFKNCTALRTLFLPTTATTIGNEAFYGCKGLDDIIIPKSVASIGTRIFRNVTDAITVYCEETAPIRSYAFDSNNVIEFKSEILVPDTVEGLIFDADLYSSNYPSIAECFNNNEGYLFLHWKNFGIYDDNLTDIFENKAVSTGSYIFNAAEYANYNPDLAEAGITTPPALLEHFVTAGYAEQRDISRHYSVKTYSREYPNVDGTTLIETYLANRLTDNADPIEIEIGDVNADGAIDSKDTIRLMRYIAKDNVSIDLTASDVNGDGAIDSRDTIRLMRKISGLV